MGIITMNDTEDLREALQVSYPVDNYTIFVRHLDNWIKEVADRDGALGQKVVIDKVQQAIQRNAISNNYHYTALAEKYREDNDEALAEHSSIVASVYRSIAEA
jgi:hypothetical protein